MLRHISYCVSPQRLAKATDRTNTTSETTPQAKDNVRRHGSSRYPSPHEHQHTSPTNHHSPPSSTSTPGATSNDLYMDTQRRVPPPTARRTHPNTHGETRRFAWHHTTRSRQWLRTIDCLQGQGRRSQVPPAWVNRTPRIHQPDHHRDDDEICQL